MRILMPHDTAIALLQNRIQELNAWDFNPDSWKATTVHNVKEIFDDLSMAFSVQNISFSTPFTEHQENVLLKGRNAARGILVGFIEILERQKKLSVEREKSYEELYAQVLQNNTILQKNIQVLEETVVLRAEQLKTQDERNDLLSTEIDRLQKDTIQFDSVSLLKLLGSFNITQWSWIGTVAAALIVGSFWIGRLYEEYESRRKAPVESNIVKVAPETVNDSLSKKHQEPAKKQDSSTILPRIEK